jgi:LPPG:FO 2-phospho-L-lactate transferase
VTGQIVVLAGGTGGAKLARGMLDVVGADRLSVVANTGDDVEIYGAYVSPDPDLITFWLADRIDDRGWGLQGDTFNVMDGLRELGLDAWFHLGDRDLALGIERARLLDGGARLTQAHARLAEQLGVKARVLPMSDRPVRTRVLANGTWWPLQEFMIKARGEGPVDDVDFRGAGAAGPSPEVADAIASASAIVIGPSNPIISIWPILETAGVREAIVSSAAPVVAVSPLVGGRVLKGPTAVCMEWAGHPLASDGIAAAYDGIIDGLIADERTDALPTLEIDVALGSPEQRREVAEHALRFAQTLG